MKWDYASEAFQEAVIIVGSMCLAAVALGLLVWLATVSVSAAIIIVFMLWIILFEEVDKWPTN